MFILKICLVFFIMSSLLEGFSERYGNYSENFKCTFHFFLLNLFSCKCQMKLYWLYSKLKFFYFFYFLSSCKCENPFIFFIHEPPLLAKTWFLNFFVSWFANYSENLKCTFHFFLLNFFSCKCQMKLYWLYSKLKFLFLFYFLSSCKCENPFIFYSWT